MRRDFFVAFTLCMFIASSGSCQVVDTLIDVGGYRLHFHIVKGEGMPILFETGSGADLSIWDTLVKPIATITHATLITYERAGFGKSELDSSNQEVDKHGILDGIKGLELALKKLGYDSNKMMVASSFGGFYATLYAARHPDVVKTAVWIDINHVCWFTDLYVATEMDERRANASLIKSSNLALYYQQLNLQNIIELMKKMPFPPNIPVTDLVSEFNFRDSISSARWSECHRQFAAAQPNREGITAYGCGHIIFTDNLPLVVSAIVKAYVGTLDKEQGSAVMRRFLSYNLVAANDQGGRNFNTGIQ